MKEQKNVVDFKNICNYGISETLVTLLSQGFHFSKTPIKLPFYVKLIKLERK